MTHPTTTYFRAIYLTPEGHLRTLEGSVTPDDDTTPVTLDAIREDLQLHLHPARLLTLDTPEDTKSLAFNIKELELTDPTKVTTFTTDH